MPDAGNVETRVAVSAGEGVRIAGLDHVVLRVGNLDRAIAFYERVLTCRVEGRLRSPGSGRPPRGAGGGTARAATWITARWGSTGSRRRRWPNICGGTASR